MSEPLAFTRVKAAIISRDFDFLDILSMVTQFSIAHPAISNALGRHAQDIFREQPADENGGIEVTMSEVVAEAYRRTFFCQEEAAKYGTEDIASNTKSMEQFADFLIRSLDEEIALGGGASLFNLVEASPATH